MLSPGVFVPIGHTKSKAELKEINNREYIVDSISHLLTPDQIEKDWASW